MHAAVHLLTALAKTALVTEGAHTTFTEPALTTQGFLIGEIAFFTAHTMPTVTLVAVLTSATFRTEVAGLAETRAALIAV